MRGKIRVLHYLRHLGLGGTEKTCQLFFENASDDFEVSVVYEKSGNHPRLEEFVKAAKVRGGNLYAIDSYKNKDIGPDGTELQALIREIKPNILHVYRSGYAEFPQPGVHFDGPKFVETNVFGHVDPSQLVDKTLFMSKWLQDYALNRFGGLEECNKITNNRFDYVNNPVEESYTHQCFGKVIDWKVENPHCVIVGRSGRPDNGIYNSVNVKAVKKLRDIGYDVRFIVLAPPSNMVDDLVENNIPFKVITPTTDPFIISMFYSSIDILAHARADGETFGVNIAEAMMHDRPVVTHIATPSVAGMGVFQSQTELVDDGETGFVVNNNVDEYAKKLEVLVASPELRKDMGEAGGQKAIEEYHVDVCVKKLERIYREIINGQLS